MAIIILSVAAFIIAILTGSCYALCYCRWTGCRPCLLICSGKHTGMKICEGVLVFDKFRRNSMHRAFSTFKYSYIHNRQTPPCTIVSHAVYAFGSTFNPIDKIVQLYDEKITLYKRMLKDKCDMIEKLEELLLKRESPC